MTVSSVIIVVTALLFAILSVSILKAVQKDSLLSGLGFAAEYCTPSLLFYDPNGAVQVLNNYVAMPAVTQAVLLDEKGSVFAAYNPENSAIIATPSKKLPLARYDTQKLFLAVPVMSEGEKIGELHAIVSTEDLNTMFWWVIGAIAVMIPFLLVLSYVFGSRLQRRISGPILGLAHVAELVQYGNTFPEISNESAGMIEIVSLTHHFREMLQRIETGEQEITQASEFLHTIVDSMPSLLLVVDEDRKITLCNSSALQFSALPQPIGSELFTSFAFLSRFEREIMDVFDSGAKKILRTEPVSANEMEQCDIELFPLRTETRSGIVISITDITELAQKDMQLIQIQKMETVGTLAGGLAHDFNNILSGIIGTLSLMELEKEEPLNREDLQEYIDVMNHAGVRAKEMIDHLLSLSHKSDTSYTRVNLIDVIRHVTRFCEHSLDKKVRIISRIDVANSLVNGNASQLEQVILNICINAAHSMTIMRSKSEPQGGDLLVTLIEEKGNLILMIQDSGVGIPKEHLKQIFDPFFTTKEKGVGTGLGLSMVLNIINQHGGSVTVDSEVGKGTTVSISLQLLTSEQIEIQYKKTSILKGIGTGKKVLIIDDDSQIRLIAGKMLDRLGFTVEVAEDGIVGIDRFKQIHHSLDLILLDMVMPGLSGKEVFAQLNTIDTSVPVILSSGFGQDDRVLDTMALGVAGFVHKPYTLKELQETIAEVLRR